MTGIEALLWAYSGLIAFLIITIKIAIDTRDDDDIDDDDIEI